MALIIAISAFPSAYATGFDQSDPTGYCQDVTMHYFELDAEDNKHDANCQLDSSCISYCSFASIMPLASAQLLFREIILKTTLSGNDTVITRYPQPLKRPPKN